MRVFVMVTDEGMALFYFTDRMSEYRTCEND